MGAATAGSGLGLYPAPCPHVMHQGAAQWVAPYSPFYGNGSLPLPASKTQCGPRAERIKGVFKDARSLKKQWLFKENPNHAAFFKGTVLELDSFKGKQERKDYEDF